MNTPQPDLTDRVRHHLHRTADDIRLTPTSPLTIATRSRRRTQRRRQLVAATSVAVVATTTVVGVRELSSNGGGQIRTQPATTPDGTADVAGPGTTGGPAPSVGGLAPAQRVDSSLVWRRVDPDSAAAIAVYSAARQLPGVALSTAPGRSDDYQPALWRTDDGVSWTQVDVTPPPFGSLQRMYAFGDRLYTYGTAPGVAATAPNPLHVDVSDDAGASWRTIDLPIDVHELRSRDHVLRTSANVTGVAVGEAGTMVAVSTYVELDWASLGIDQARVVELMPDGVELLDAGCGSLASPTTTIVVGASSSAGQVPTGTEAPVDGSTGTDGECATSLATWADLGIDADVAAVAGRPRMRWFFTGDDGPFVEVDPPAGLLPSTGFTASNDIVVSGVPDDPTVTTPRYFRWDGTAWQELDAGPSTWLQRDGDRWFGAGRATTERWTAVFSPDGTTWQQVDLTPLIGDQRGVQYVEPVPGAVGQTIVMSTASDALAAAGGNEIVEGDVVARVDSSFGDARFLDATTREPIAPSLVTWTEDRVEIGDGAGGVRATFDAADVVALYDTPSGTDPAVRWQVLHTDDGTSFSVESVAELAGVEESAVNSVSPIGTMGASVLLSVALTDTNPDGSHKRIVLIGTPAG